MIRPRAFIVCVDYWDYLRVTLPYNRHHFEDIHVITSPQDKRTIDLCKGWGVKCMQTNSFYDDGASFNKWKALELGLSYFGRNGIICLMDADVLWPKEIPTFEVELGNLYTPHRRMYPGRIDNGVLVLPPENTWHRYRVHPVPEFSGYTQLFDGDDPVLGNPPWHQVDWIHAGGADSFFQMKWSDDNKIRPPFEVLHIGPHGTNWFGRVSNYLDGTAPENAEQKASQFKQAIQTRRQTKSYEGEKIK